MIALKPQPFAQFQCPECGAALAVEKIVVPGMNVYATCTCKGCGVEFSQMLPVGHFTHSPITIKRSDQSVYNGKRGYQWLSDIARATFPLLETEVQIRKIIFTPHKDVVVLNALDFLYGHSLLKLYNAQHHLTHHQDLGLVIILPVVFEWMIPAGCAEVWVVDLPLSDLKKGYSSISRFAEREFRRFNSVFLSRAYSHPDYTQVDIARFTGIKPFDLSDFYKTKPCITFVLREDRWWFGHHIDHWFYRLCRKMRALPTGSKILARRQNGLVRKAIRLIRQEYPTADFYIVGLGKTGDYRGAADDRRKNQLDASGEKEWCSIYSRSHVVIGFHGSNMLLPTAFAAGCVEILPDDRYGNMIQDISVRYADRLQLFFYRFVAQYSGPHTVAAHASAIIRDYRDFNLNMCRNIYDTNTNGSRKHEPTKSAWQPTS